MPDQIAKPVFTEDGMVEVPAFVLPPSPYISAQALAAQQYRAKIPGAAPPADLPIAVVRQGIETMLSPQVERMRALYAVDITEDEIAGVAVRIVAPADRAPDPDRLLLNVHGGAFCMCEGACALLESVPIAAESGIKVITVNYRMAPEAQHPAAVQDLATVYAALLADWRPEQIGIYGCSAGGALTAQAAAWLPAHGLPQAGAVGIFGAGGVRFGAGDSAWITAYIDGSFPVPANPGEPPIDITHGYFAGQDMTDPMISPALHLDVLAKFPPALIITGTRAMDLSPAVFTNSQLIKAKRKSTLIVGEGMGHCYIYQPDLPEAQDARTAIVDFFRENLG